MLPSLRALVSAIFISTAVFGLVVNEAPEHFEVQPQLKGIDVSNYQPNVNWGNVVASGVVFVYIKATEGTTYKSPSFSSQYTGATNAGLIRGGYHFALPDKSPAAAQAEWFVSHGGGWTSDGITLPGAVDMEPNPYGAPCYGLTPTAMVYWIVDFSTYYHSRTGRYPVIYTSTYWWRMCTGDSSVFSDSSPLWIARYAGAVGPLPRGWDHYTFWQYADHGPVPGDQNYYNGSIAALQRFARGP